LSIEMLALIALGALAGFGLAPYMLRQSSIEEMGLLIEEGSSDSLLKSLWAEDEFPEFFASGWDEDDRAFYKRLSRRLRGARYGESRKLILKLIRIEDERQEAKGKLPSEVPAPEPQAWSGAEGAAQGGGPPGGTVRLLRRGAAEPEAAAPKEGGDRHYSLRMTSLLEAYKRKGGFESVLAAFIEKRYKERKDGDRR
jgi:hypothetical protein